MGQDDAMGQRLNESDEPFVAGGGFDDGFELSQLLEEPSDGCFVGASQPLAPDNLTGWVHDADGDSLFVQVAAGVKHGCSLLWKRKLKQFTFTTLPSTPPAGSACS